MNYSTPFRPYQSMYVDMRLPERAQLERDRYDAAKEEKTLLDRAIGKIRLGKGDDPVKQRLLSEIKGMIGDRPDFENIGHIVNDATTRFMTDTELLNALDSYGVRQKEMAKEAELRMQGKLLDFGNRYQKDASGKVVMKDGKPVQTHVFDEWNTASKGIYSPHAEERGNWEQTAQQMMSGIAEDPVALSAVAASAGLTVEEAKAFLKYGTGVSDAKVRKIAEVITDEFMHTTDGNQLYRTFKELDIDPSTGGTYDESSARNKVTEFLSGIGKKQVGAKYSYIGKPQKEVEEQPVGPGRLPVDEVLDNSGAENDAAASFLSGLRMFDGETPDPNAGFPSKNWASRNVDPTLVSAKKAKLLKEYTTLKKSKPIGDWTEAEIKQYAWAIMDDVTKNPKINKYRNPGETDENFAERYVRASKGSTYSYVTPILTGDAKTSASKMMSSLFSSGQDKQIFKVAGTTDWVTGKVLLDKLEGGAWTESEEDVKEKLLEQLKEENAAIELVNTGPNAGMFRVQFDNPGNGPKDFYVRAAKSQTEGFELLRAIGTNAQKKDPSGVEALSKEEMRALTSQKDAQGRPLFPGLSPDDELKVVSKFIGNRFVPVIELNGRQVIPAPGQEENDSWVQDMANGLLQHKIGTDSRIFGHLREQKLERSKVE